MQHIGAKDVNVKNYKLAAQCDQTNGELGTAIYVHSQATYDIIQINSKTYQPTAIALHIPGAGKINIINMYNQPIFHYNVKDANRVIKSISHPKLIVGDFNSHNPIWDDSREEADQGGGSSMDGRRPLHAAVRRLQ